MRKEEIADIGDMFINYVNDTKEAVSVTMQANGKQEIKIMFTDEDKVETVFDTPSAFMDHIQPHTASGQKARRVSELERLIESNKDLMAEILTVNKAFMAEYEALCGIDKAVPE